MQLKCGYPIILESSKEDFESDSEEGIILINKKRKIENYLGVITHYFDEKLKIYK